MNRVRVDALGFLLGWRWREPWGFWGHIVSPSTVGFRVCIHVNVLSNAAASLIQVVAVAAAGPVVTLAELPDASARLQHQLLGHGHHHAEEVGILKCLGNVKMCQNKFFVIQEWNGWYKNRDEWLTEAGRQKTDCSVTRRSVKSTSLVKSGKCSMSIPTCVKVNKNQHKTSIFKTSRRMFENKDTKCLFVYFNSSFYTESVSYLHFKIVRFMKICMGRTTNV